MKGLPYFRWWPADAETDSTYAAMTWAERGFYHWCLNYSWINNGLPGDVQQISKAARMSSREFSKLWECVGKCFTNVDGSYRNRRQEEERTHAKSKSERATESVRTRYERRTDVPTNVLPRAQARAESVCVSDSGISLERGSGGKPAVRWKSDEQYVRFVADYLGTGAALIDADFAEAFEFCWRTLDFEQKLQRVAGLNRHAEEYHADPRFVPKPRKFLEVEWARAPRPPAARGPQSTSLADRAIALMEKRIANGEKPL